MRSRCVSQAPVCTFGRWLVSALRINCSSHPGINNANTTDTLASCLFPVLAAVSDTANGAQVLLDEASWLGIREELRRLGAVGAKGMNYKLLYHTPQYGLVERCRGQVGG